MCDKHGRLNMDISVYLFTGFLEAGKTKFIEETMQDPGFNDGKRKYLIILYINKK